MLRAPRQLPPLEFMMDDLRVSVPVLARHLRVSERTVWGWKAAEQAPHPAMLAMFWETKWGQSLFNTTMFNECPGHRSYHEGLEREIATLRTQISRLEALGGFGSANMPMYAAR